MKQDKDLLLKYLCMALPYRVKVWYKYYPKNVTERFATSIRLADEKIALSSKFNKEGDWHPIEEADELLIKPYLHPMSSMTEEEAYEFLLFADTLFRYGKDNDFCCLSLDAILWLLEHHFDFMGLIPKGLAIEVTKENNPYKN